MSWLTLAAFAGALLLPSTVQAQRQATADADLRLELHALNASATDLISDSRVFRLAAPGRFNVIVRNTGSRVADARLWILRGTDATQIWTGSVPAGGTVRAQTYNVAASTDVVLLQWGAAAQLDAGGVAMEGPNSRVYYFVADAPERLGQARVASADAVAAEPSAALEHAFDVAAEARKESFETLLRVRTVTRVLVGVPNFKALRLALQQVHEPGSAMLMYAPVGDVLETWMITPEGELLHHVGGRVEDALVALREFRRALGVDLLQASRSPQQRGVQGTAVGAEASRRAASLGRAARGAAAVLYPPTFHAALRRAKHLVIVPAFDFGATPFSALPHPAGGETVEHATVVVAPSICDVMQVGHRVQFAELSRRPLILGDPLYPTESSWIFPQLPGAAAEAEAVALALKAPWFSGREASRELVRTRLPDATLIYVATHGIASATSAMDSSFLQLADDASAGRWTAREIQSQPLRARLAVLSACQTGLGMAHDGGIIGVARSFLNAGSSQVVMSLWNVDDEATKRLMLGLMAALEDHSPPEALRQAMLAERRRRGSRPALWASFTILGATW